VVDLRPLHGARPTVELAWTLAALSADAQLPATHLRAAVATRLLDAAAGGGLFPHVAGTRGRGPRAHVGCFADLVYPIHALSRYGRLTGDRRALAAAVRCADRTVAAQGRDGQWWWHYDVRSGAVIEGYPVYAVHQDAMAPLAFFALEEATGLDFAEPLARGGSLIDPAAGLIWRKVARREPGKLSRTLRGAATRLRAGARLPGLDAFFPPGAVDREDRPYHLGWLLHAFPAGELGAARARRIR
jgi:hypothetical protein